MRASARAAAVALLALGIAVAVLAHGHAEVDTAATAVPACVPPGAGTHRIVIDTGRAPVSLHVPPGPPATGRPLILVLPGAGQTGADIAAYTGYSRLADQRGFLVAYPTASGTRPFWNVSGTAPGKPDDVAYLRKVITSLSAVACADGTRVGMTGVSNGGGMTARLACDGAGLVAAAAPVAGGYGSLPGCDPVRPVPILEIHGTSDRVVPYAGKGATGLGSVSRFLAQWLRLDGCSRTVTRRSSPAAGVTELRWSACRGGAAVVHDRIQDAIHGWTGLDDVLGRHGFSATARTWAFLSAYVR
jgi:polyhydroxybutyrate depolymerase